MLSHTKIHISNLWQFSQKAVINKNENIGFDKYIGNLILWMYWDISRNIGEYFEIKYQWGGN